MLGGVLAGRVLGKLAGITAATWLAVRLGLARPPEATSWGQLAGVATVAGIGFTVPLFVADLAFPDGRFQAPVKLGLLLASVVAGAAGALVLAWPPGGWRTAGGPTEGCTNASGRAWARRWVAFQPVQWPGTTRSTPKSAKAAIDGSMIGSNTAPVRWKPPTKPDDPVAAGEPPGVVEHVDGAGVGAAGHHHQALAGDVDDHVLVVEDQRVGLPAVAGPGLVDGEAGLELGDPGDLAGDQHLAVEQQGGAALLHHLQALGLQVGPAGRGQVELGPGREGDLAVPPGPGVEQQGQAAASGAGGQALQAAVVVDVAVGDDDGPQPGRVDLHDVEVVGQAPGGHAAVVQDRAAAAARDSP